MPHCSFGLGATPCLSAASVPCWPSAPTHPRKKLSLPLTGEIVDDVLEAELGELGDGGEGPLGVLDDAVYAVGVGGQPALGAPQRGNGPAAASSLLHPAHRPRLLHGRHEGNCSGSGEPRFLAGLPGKEKGNLGKRPAVRVYSSHSSSVMRFPPPFFCFLCSHRRHCSKATIIYPYLHPLPCTKRSPNTTCNKR